MAMLDNQRVVFIHDSCDISDQLTLSFTLRITQFLEESRLRDPLGRRIRRVYLSWRESNGYWYTSVPMCSMVMKGAIPINSNGSFNVHLFISPRAFVSAAWGSILAHHRWNVGKTGWNSMLGCFKQDLLPYMAVFRKIQGRKYGMLFKNRMFFFTCKKKYVFYM